MPMPAYLPLVCCEKLASSFGENSSLYGSFSSFTMPRAAFS